MPQLSMKLLASFQALLCALLTYCHILPPMATVTATPCAAGQEDLELCERDFEDSEVLKGGRVEGGGASRRANLTGTNGRQKGKKSRTKRYFEHQSSKKFSDKNAI